MRRRDFITLLGGAAVAPLMLLPLAARAQQPKRVGILISGAAADPTWQARLATFVQGLRKLGWIDGENLQIEVRWNAADVNLTQAYATDLVGLFKPDVLLAVGSLNLITLQRATSTIPIVFTLVTDPVAQGFVPNLTHPGRNITGFAMLDSQSAGSGPIFSSRWRLGSRGSLSSSTPKHRRSPSFI
jgi:putative ABC transport system substrate-binding protein